AIGHEPNPELSIQDLRYFKAFQANLLSLISHELRTPLTGIINALNFLNEQEIQQGGMSSAELLAMARRNAQRLQQALDALLDMAALESGLMNAMLKEIDLSQLFQSRIKAHDSLFKDRDLRVESAPLTEHVRTFLLADPQKLRRAIDLCLQILTPRAAV